jgi:hypothetical protein
MNDEMIDDGHEPATRGELRGVRDELRARLDGHDRRFDGIDGHLRRLNIGFVKMDGDLAELKGEFKVMKADFSRFSILLERVSGNIEAGFRKFDIQGSMLMEHESRITKLESRPS